MATSGTITGSFNGSNARYLTFRCEWSVLSQDKANKTSNVRLRWIVTKTTSNLYTNKSNAPWGQTCDGVGTDGTLNFNLGDVNANTDYVIRDVTATIAHNANGTKTASIDGVLDLSGTTAGTGTFNGTMALPTIATTPPTVSALTVSDVGTKPSTVSAYVAGYTKFKLTATASATSPATIASYAFYNGSTLLQSGTSNTFTYSAPNSAGSYTFKVVVTDSYGNSTTKTINAVTVVAYSVPTVSATTFRCNSSGTADGSGTYASLKMTWTIANISGNTATVHKVTFNGADTTLTSGTAVIKSGVSTTSSYRAVYLVTDSFNNSATITQTIQSEFVNFDLYPDSASGGVGIGMVAELGYFASNLMVKSYKGYKALPTDDILADADAIPESGAQFYMCNGGSYTGSVPHSNYKYGKGFAVRRTATGIFVVLFPEDSSLPPIYNAKTSSGWSGWYGQLQTASVTNFAPTAANSWQQVSGLTLTAPVTGMYSIEALAHYNNSEPMGVAIITRGSSSSYTDWSACIDRASSGINIGTTQNLKTSYSGYLTAGDVVSVYAKYNSASSSNTVILRMKSLW